MQNIKTTIYGCRDRTGKSTKRQQNKSGINESVIPQSLSEVRENVSLAVYSKINTSCECASSDFYV